MAVPKYRVIILPRAGADIVEICSYIEAQSAQRAVGVAEMIIKAIDSLDALPHRCRIHENRRDPALTVRAMSVQPFVVYYRVDDVRGAVRILTVRHGARRQPKRWRD
jgi:plasmid stabilization system protein ParE